MAPAAAAPAGSEPVYDYAKAVRETVWVDIGRDGDGPVCPDRVAADIVRPGEADGVTRSGDHGRQPVLLCCGRGNETQLKTYDANGNPVQFPLYYDNYFVPRGYAVVLVDLAGTEPVGGLRRRRRRRGTRFGHGGRSTG